MLKKLNILSFCRGHFQIINEEESIGTSCSFVYRSPKIQLKNYNAVRCNILGNNGHLQYICRIESRTNTRTPDTEVMNFVHLAKDPYS